MSILDRHAAPVENYAATLAAALHGPARVKARLVDEIRDGFADAVEVHAREDRSCQRAADAAVRDFGTPDEIAPSCQRELTVAQARYTARSVVLAVLLMIVCWHLVGTAGHGQSWQLPLTAGLMAGVVATVALLAAAALLATGPLERWLPVPGWVPLVVAWVGTATGVGMALATLLLVITSPAGASWPLVVLAGALLVVAHGFLTRSARACRQCAQLHILS